MMAGELVQAPKSNKPKQYRLTDTDKAYALRYAKDGLSQTEIAKRLGVTQSAISQWLLKCQDVRTEAAQYLDGQALHLAERAVKKASPDTIVKLLTGRGVLQNETSGPNIVIQIGGADVDVCLVTAQNKTS